MYNFRVTFPAKPLTTCHSCYHSTDTAPQPTIARPNVARSIGLATEWLSRSVRRDSLPIRVVAGASAQFAARKQDQRLAQERRLAQPGFFLRNCECNWEGGSLRRRIR